jgi:hypothetical protein
VKLKLGG